MGNRYNTPALTNRYMNSFPLSAGSLFHATSRFTRALALMGFGLLAATFVYAQDKPTAKPSAPVKSATPDSKATAPNTEPVVKRSSTEKTVGKAIVVTPLNKAEIPKSCGCAFYTPTSARDSGPMLLWLDNKGKAQMQLDGKREDFNMTSERMVKRRKDTDKLSAGDRILVTLRSTNTQTGLQASVASSAERNCTISAAQCSAPTFRSLITLSKGESRKSMAAFGVCSCPGSSKPFTPSAPAAAPTQTNATSKPAAAATAASTKSTAGSNPRPAAK
jgi:hypothetical protein